MKYYKTGQTELESKVLVKVQKVGGSPYSLGLTKTRKKSTKQKVLMKKRSRIHRPSLIWLNIF